MCSFPLPKWIFLLYTLCLSFNKIDLLIKNIYIIQVLGKYKTILCT